MDIFPARSSSVSLSNAFASFTMATTAAQLAACTQRTPRRAFTLGGGGRLKVQGPQTSGSVRRDRGSDGRCPRLPDFIRVTSNRAMGRRIKLWVAKEDFFSMEINQ